MAKSKKNKKNIIITVVVTLALILIAGGIWVWATMLPGYLSAE